MNNDFPIRMLALHHTTVPLLRNLLRLRLFDILPQSASHYQRTGLSMPPGTTLTTPLALSFMACRSGRYLKLRGWPVALISKRKLGDAACKTRKPRMPVCLD